MSNQALERIASALERIAKALEATPEPQYEVAEVPRRVAITIDTPDGPVEAPRASFS